MSTAQELDLARLQADYYEGAALRAFVDGDMDMAGYYCAQCERYVARAAALTAPVAA